MNISSINPLQQCQPDPTLPDGEARFEAIYPGQSFIVQAPAGSGKTALLMQRFLALLSQVDFPEQVVAMTFTKKAAAEMRNRILEALQFGCSPLAKQASVFDQNTWQLAQAALQNNAQRDWQLLANPNRLRIRTLDGMNGYLVQQMPLLSRLGVQPQIADQQDQLYAQAARAALEDAEATEASAELLQLVNGKLTTAVSLLVSMLKKRDQWMRVLLPYEGDDQKTSASARLALQAGVADLVMQEKQAALVVLNPVLSGLQGLGCYAEWALSNGVDESLAARLSVLVDWSQSNAPLKVSTDLAVWRALAAWLLTKEGSWLKTVNKNKGFPAGKGENKANKEAFLAVLAEVSLADFQGKAAAALQQISQLPDIEYRDADWQRLQNLIRLLRRAVAHLSVAFQQAAQTDFIEVAQAATKALGEAENPTDLAQQLDYQLKHLLIDEFQDTSVGQYELVKKLVASWTAEDAHTIFIVGDPMQSIYRFREAEVGNFLEAWQGQLGQVPLKALNLTVNFRSSAGLVNWVNQTFKQVFPAKNQLALGGVCYAKAIAQDVDPETADIHHCVKTHWRLAASKTQEVDEVVTLIQQRLQADDFSDQAVIGVLGRSRGHLMPIASALKQAGIAFRAVDLEVLKDRQEIQDCQALTRALLHLGDRPAWIALLRSPLIGLSLADLSYLLTENGRPTSGTVWQRLEAFEGQNRQKNDQAWSDWADKISAEGQARLAETLPILQHALQTKGAVALAVWLRQTWLALDGPQTLMDAGCLQNVDAYWQRLAEMADEATRQQQGGSISITALEETLAELYALPDTSPESRWVELMTMHKSKGLEFDTVILPCLGRKPRNDDIPLMSWLAFKSAQKEQLVIAPLQQKGKANTAKPGLVELIKRYEDQKQDYELARLLYVACTRAKRQLHCFGSVNVTDKILAGETELNPVQKSLLACLWPLEKANFEALLPGFHAADKDHTLEKAPVKISRLQANRQGFWQQQPPALIQEQLPATEKPPATESEGGSPELSAFAISASEAEMVKAVGVWVHQVLEQWAKDNQRIPSLDGLLAERSRHQFGLMQLGLRDPLLNLAIDRVMQSLQNVLQNTQVMWALRSDHLEAAAEWPLSSLEKTSQGGVQSNHIVDRTFVDETGMRWIIDYKTSYFPLEESGEKRAAELAVFVEKQVVAYRDQLQRYGDLFDALETRPQKWVLYFTHLDQWVEVA